MKAYGISDVGRVRLVNQDSFTAKTMKNGCFIAVVCDGMGGSAGGGIASSIAKDVFLTELEKLIDGCVASDFIDGAPSVVLPRMLKEAVARSNAFTYDLSVHDPGLKGMGTTLVAALLYKENAYVCNVGDSRLYAFRGGRITQITRDHSYVQELIDSGRINARDAKDNANKNIITRAVGVEPKVKADAFVLPLRGVDYILLCTDGLTNYLEPKDLQKIVLSDVLGLEKKVQTLVDLANGRGGRDNVTAYLMDFGTK